jgi:CheY-like chemotaxis protein
MVRSGARSRAVPARKLTLWSLSWPLFVEQGLRISIGTVDTLMVSHVSDNAVAALGVAWQIVILSLIVFNFLGIGSSVVMTHHLGAGDRPGADRIARATIGVNTWIGIALSSFIFGARRPLQRAGYDVLEASDGVQGSRIFDERRSDVTVVVTDVVMPIAGGVEMVSGLRARRPMLPVVFVSGYTAEDQDLPLDERTTFLTKPYTIDALCDAIGSVVPA